VKITLLPELFDPPVRNTLLIALLGYPHIDRHRVELDIAHTGVATWLAAQSQGVREEIDLALAWSTHEEVREPSSTTVLVIRGPSDLEHTPPRINIDEARRFLDNPFVILLEDARSDRAFLLRMMTDEERDFLQRRIDAGAVRIDHGGGVGPMTSRIRDDARVPANRYTEWILFDSDAMRPGAPSPASEALRVACGILAHHQLRRRYAESYLTRQALESWANVARRVEREARLRRYRAFVSMRDEQRHHYNMKNGFERDGARTDANAGQLYDGVSDADRRDLAHGFGEDIGDLFDGDSITEAHLRHDTTGWAELRPVVRDLLARIR
jgi:hypothetical protein